MKQIAKFVVGLGEKVAPTDIEEGMRVGVDRTKYQIQIPLPPKIDPSVTMMTVEEKPDVTYSDIGGSKEQIEKMREVVELPLLHPEKFVQLGIDPPKGVLCYGPPGARGGGGAGGQAAQLVASCLAGRLAPAAKPAAGAIRQLPGAEGSAVGAVLPHACTNKPPSLILHRHGQDAAGAGGGQPHGRVLHPRHWQRAGAEVCGRGAHSGAGPLHWRGCAACKRGEGRGGAAGCAAVHTMR